MPPPQLLHHQLLTVSVHVGVFTLLYGGLVLQTDLHLAAVRPVVHDDLTATRATLNTRPLGISLSQHLSRHFATFNVQLGKTATSKL